MTENKSLSHFGQNTIQSLSNVGHKSVFRILQNSKAALSDNVPDIDIQDADNTLPVILGNVMLKPYFLRHARQLQSHACIFSNPQNSSYSWSKLLTNKQRL